MDQTKARGAGLATAPTIGGERKTAMMKEGCWFCGGPNTGSERSAEDYWPRWLWPHPKFVETAKKSSMTGFEPRVAMMPGEDVVIITQGMRRAGRSRINDKAPGFCRRCNNGWMSGIQDYARNHLGHAFFAEQGALDRDQQAALARWVTMTAMVIDTHQGETPLVPVNDRKFFGASHVMPNGTSILVGRFAGSIDNARCWKGGAAGLKDGRWLEGWGSSILAVGDLFVVAAFGGRFPLALSTHLEAMGLQWIYPRTFASIDLDQRPALQDGALDHIGHCFHLWSHSVLPDFKGDLGALIAAVPAPAVGSFEAGGGQSAEDGANPHPA